MVQHYTLTLNGSIQRLSSVLPQGTTDGTIQNEQSWSFVSLQAGAANSGVVYVGGYPQTVSSSAYGFRIEIPVTSIPGAPVVFELGGGPSIRLSEFQVIGTNNDTLHILVKD